MHALLLRALVLCTIFAVAGCSTISGWFDDDEDPKAPVALVDIEPQVKLRKLWSAAVGNGQGEGLYKIKPVLAGDAIYAASADGLVRAVHTDTGRVQWKAKMRKDLSGGVGYYDGALLLGSSEGDVLKLDASSGELLWSTALHGEVLAAPQANGEVVIAQTYDGRLQSLDYTSGELLWTYDSNVPVLTVRGTSTPIIDGSVVYAGFANGRVLAVEALTGSIVWELRVAIPQGRSEIDRIVDVDGTMSLLGGELYAASYQGRIVGIEVANGRKVWQQDASSFSGVAQGFDNIYVADEDGTVTAFLRNGQGVRWTQAALGYRELTRPTPVSSYVAVADFEGYVHILSQVDGEIVGRVRADRSGARADMLAEGNVLYVYGDSGKLIAYEVIALGQ